MNHKKVKKQINKINAFFDSITADDEISSIEQDLLLSYIRKLYESVLDRAPSTVAPSKKSTPNAKKEMPSERPTAPVIPERKPFERAVREEVSTVEPTSVSTVHAPAVAVQTAQSQTATEVIDIPTKVGLSEKMQQIFERKGGNELSDKLSSMPIKDLTKAMSINERIFTIQELFGGDQDLFNDTLSKLNQLNDYEEAKSYLVNGIATDHNWDEAGRYKKAQNFIKLVQRRFS